MDDYFKTLERRLKRFPPADAKVLGDWLRAKPVGINLALQFLEQIQDLAKITGKSPADLLPELLDEVAAKDLHSKELGRRLRDALDRRLNPSLHAHETAFRKLARALALPPSLRLLPPQNFEGREFTLQLPFASLEEMEQGLEGLKASLVAHPEAWRKLWTL